MNQNSTIKTAVTVAPDGINSQMVTQAVLAARATFLLQPEGRVQTPMSLYEINCGQCDDFAEHVSANLGLSRCGTSEQSLIVENDNFRRPIDGDFEGEAERIWDGELLAKAWGMTAPAGFTWDQMDDLDFGNHIWFAAKVGPGGTWLHFDSECAEGVANFFELPIFARTLVKDWPTMAEIEAFPRDQVWSRAAQALLAK